MADKEWFDATPGSPTFGVSYGTHSPSNVLLSLQAGCDFQAGNWVIGVQGEYGWSDARDSNRNSLIAGFADRTEIKALGTATARLGYAWDRVLGYLKGGAAWEHDNYEIYLVGTDLVTAKQVRPGEVGPPASAPRSRSCHRSRDPSKRITTISVGSRTRSRPPAGVRPFRWKSAITEGGRSGGMNNWQLSAGPVAAEYDRRAAPTSQGDVSFVPGAAPGATFQRSRRWFLAPRGSALRGCPVVAVLQVAAVAGTDAAKPDALQAILKGAATQGLSGR